MARPIVSQSPELARCASELIATHDAIEAVLCEAWSAGISLLNAPGDRDRYEQCSIVVRFIRDAHAHIRNEDGVVFANAWRAGVSPTLLDGFRAEHQRLCSMMAALPPLLDDRRTLDAAAVSVLRLVARFEQHLAHEELVIASLAGPT